MNASHKGPLSALLEVGLGPIASIEEFLEARVTNRDIRRRFFWTGNYAQYDLKDGKIVLSIVPQNENLIFQQSKLSVQQLNRQGHFIPSPEDAHKVMLSAIASSSSFNLSDLALEEMDEEACCFSIKTQDPHIDKTQEQQRLIAHFYGKDTKLEQKMKFLYDQKIYETKIEVLNPNYFYSCASQTVARLTGIRGLINNSSIVLHGRCIDNPETFVYGDESITTQRNVQLQGALLRKAIEVVTYDTWASAMALGPRDAEIMQSILDHYRLIKYC